MQSMPLIKIKLLTKQVIKKNFACTLGKELLPSNLGEDKTVGDNGDLTHRSVSLA